ncbi:MAG: hypothetical protein KDA31_01920 [Phycisphaerales bacterium]|nr:hypothetical protein [Phycisphaerales bacterium]MCB9835134.1 hypothetical protein [Phycisphaera sp.]
MDNTPALIRLFCLVSKFLSRLEERAIIRNIQKGTVDDNICDAALAIHHRGQRGQLGFIAKTTAHSKTKAIIPLLLNRIELAPRLPSELGETVSCDEWTTLCHQAIFEILLYLDSDGYDAVRNIAIVSQGSTRAMASYTLCRFVSLGIETDQIVRDCSEIMPSVSPDTLLPRIRELLWISDRCPPLIELIQRLRAIPEFEDCFAQLTGIQDFSESP